MSSDDEVFADVVWSSDELPHAAIHPIASFKLPPFWTSRPKLWLPGLITQVADVVEAPPAAGKFQALKERLISAFAVSEDTEYQELLRGLELSDQRPLQLLRVLRIKSASRVSEAFLKSLWLRRVVCPRKFEKS